MFDTIQDLAHDQRRHGLLSHDRPCPRCDHAMHTYLACSDRCACRPADLPVPALAAC